MVPGDGFVLFQLALSQTMPGHGPGIAWAKEHHHRRFRCSPPVLEGKTLISKDASWSMPIGLWAKEQPHACFIY